MQSAGILLYVEDLHQGATPISGKKTFLRSLLIKNGAVSWIDIGIDTARRLNI